MNAARLSQSRPAMSKGLDGAKKGARAGPSYAEQRKLKLEEVVHCHADGVVLADSGPEQGGGASVVGCSRGNIIAILGFRMLVLGGYPDRGVQVIGNVAIDQLVGL